MSDRLSTVGDVSRTHVGFRCQDCGATTPKWTGRCGTCSAWNTLVEELRSTTSRTTAAGPAPQPPLLITEIDTSGRSRFSTGEAEVDRVLGGGFVPGSVTLVGGEPGIGKSTLLLQVLAAMSRGGLRVLYISAEESSAQVRLRAERLGALAPTLWLASETVLSHVLSHLDEIVPDVLVVDSIQTIFDPELGSTPGTVGQVRECAARLVDEAKRREITTLLVGHVTKDGNLAGPRVLEHMVDTVLSFEGDRHHALRLLRATKHRFGSTNQLGLFAMAEQGLEAVPDPSKLFLADRCPSIPGSVVVATVDGHRPLLVEVQALVAPSHLPSPRRSAQGLDSGRLALITAVLGRRVGLDLGDHDVHALAVGGVKIVEPAADLAIVLAIASSAHDVPLPEDLVVCGEVGLGGELRQVGQFERRLGEASRLGFRRAVIPHLAPDPPPGIVPIRAATIAEALELLGFDADFDTWSRGGGSACAG